MKPTATTRPKVAGRDNVEEIECEKEEVVGVEYPSVFNMGGAAEASTETR